MKKYLVDVPVKINIWIREECQKKQWEVIKKARPSILFIQSDGGRNEHEWEAIRKNRKMIDESIDWDCQVYRLYEEKNNGLYVMGKKRNDLIWSTVDRCVFLEDDHLPSVSYFRFCAELLERYKDDLRIECICGVNCFEKSEDVTADYFFSKQGSIWGYATWRNRFTEDSGFEYYSDPYIMRLLKEKTNYDQYTWRRLNGYAQDEHFENHVPGSEFWIDFNMYAQERMQIIPKYNLISNIGCTEDSLHSTKYEYLSSAMKKVFNAKIYELEFPLKHPKYVISDDKYMLERDILMGRNHKVRTFVRRIESRLYRLKYGGLKAFLSFKGKGVEK